MTSHTSSACMLGKFCRDYANGGDRGVWSMVQEWRCGDYLISTDKSRLDLAVIHGFITTSYWAAGISIEIVKRSIEHSRAFGVYKGDRQIGFARVITDY